MTKDQFILTIRHPKVGIAYSNFQQGLIDDFSEHVRPYVILNVLLDKEEKELFRQVIALDGFTEIEFIDIKNTAVQIHLDKE